MADRLAREEGLHVGHSSGANVFAALQVAARAAAERARRVRRRHRVRPRRPLLRADEVGAPVRVVAPCRYAGSMRDVTKHPWVERQRRRPARACSTASTTRRARRTRATRRAAASSSGPADDAAPCRRHRARWSTGRTSCTRSIPRRTRGPGRMYFDIDSMKFDAAIREGEAEGAPGEGALPLAPRRRRLLLGHRRRGREDGAGRAALGSRLPGHERPAAVGRRPKLFVWDPAGAGVRREPARGGRGRPSEAGS